MQDLRWPTYPSRGVCLDAAVAREGGGSLRVRDTEGREYLDAIAGIGCVPIGHAHPAWIEAIHRQLGAIASAANSFHTEPALRLAARLGELFPIPDARVFFCNSGTEATEAGIKLALRATGRNTIVAFERAFHGRTLAALSLTANPAYRAPYLRCSSDEGTSETEPFAAFRVLRLPYDDLEALTRCFAEHGSEIAAVVMEPIQGEAGVYPASRDFLVGARALCTEHGALLAMDEIQSGCGRTGEWAAWTAIVGDAPPPDILWLAKALGGGFPIGACLTTASLAEAMSRGSHGTTFGGNPVACAAALATIEIIEAEGLRAQAAAQLDTLRAIAAERPLADVVELRGVGAMIGIALSRARAEQIDDLGGALMERGVLATTPGGHTVRALLPYFAGRAELEELWSAIADLLQA